MMQHLFGPALVALTSLLTSGQAAPNRHHRSPIGGSHQSDNAKAIYFITNDASNSIAAVPIGSDGMLYGGNLIPTGGNGGSAIDAATNGTAGLDGLFSQSSLTIAGNYIFAVNPGSNTVSMFSINPWSPTQLTAVGKPVALPGQFPVTVAASAKNQLVCVGTTGTENGVSCTSFSSQGLGSMDGLRSFDLVQQTPPVGPLNTVTQLFFSEDESKLFATVKGDPTVNNTGFFSVFPVEQGGWGQQSTLASNDIRSSPAGTAVLFGSADIAGTSNTFVTDASFGAAVIAVDPVTNIATTVGKQAIEGQLATCWATISGKTGTAFVTDVLVNRLVEMSLTDASIVSILDLTPNGDPGLLDLEAAGNFIYALSPGNGTTKPAVTVIDVSGGSGSAKQVQHFDLSGLGVDEHAQGMAVF